MKIIFLMGGKGKINNKMKKNLIIFQRNHFGDYSCCVL
jgi:hypothetical protein